MNKRGIYNYKSLKQAKSDRKIEIMEREAVLKANYTLIKKKTCTAGILPTILSAFSEKNDTSAQPEPSLATEIVDGVLELAFRNRQKNSMIQLLLKQLAHSVASRYSDTINRYVAATIHVFSKKQNSE